MKDAPARDGTHPSLRVIPTHVRTGCTRRIAHPATPGTTPDIAKNITITVQFLALARYIINNWVDPASEEFPTGTAIPGEVVVVNTLPHGNIEVPCYDETVAGAGVENTLG